MCQKHSKLIHEKPKLKAGTKYMGEKIFNQEISCFDLQYFFKIYKRLEKNHANIIDLYTGVMHTKAWK